MGRGSSDQGLVSRFSSHRKQKRHKRWSRNLAEKIEKASPAFTHAKGFKRHHWVVTLGVTKGGLRDKEVPKGMTGTVVDVLGEDEVQVNLDNTWLSRDFLNSDGSERSAVFAPEELVRL